MQQAKRRMAAQRERELRNYHQEQQYNRSKFMRLQISISYDMKMLRDDRCLRSRQT